MTNHSNVPTESRTSLKTLAFVVVIILSVTAYTKWASDTEISHESFAIGGSGNIGSYRGDRFINEDSGRVFDSLDCSFLASIQSKISQVQLELFERWNISHYPNFKTTLNIPKSSWELQKAKFMRLLLEANVNHALNGAKTPPFDLSFVAGFAGSSVTAGHDNYFREAFPQVFHDTMAPVFSVLEVPFTVRNHALGNNPCYPYDACIATHLGDDLDLLAWEQSLNCGRWSPPLDTFSRQASYMKKKPTLLFITSGGPTWTRQDCAIRNITTSAERGPLTAAERDILARSAQKNAELNAFLQQFTFLRDGDGAYLASRFASLAPMAQSVFGIGDYKCLGPYNSTFCEKTPGGGAPHHPGKLMHLFRGQNLAYFYLTMLAEAAQEVRALACPRVAPRALREVPVSTEGSTEKKTQDPGLSGWASKRRAYPRSASVVRALVDGLRPKIERKLTATSAAGPASVYDVIVSALNRSLPEVPSALLSVPPASGVVSARDLYRFVREYVQQIQAVPLPPVPANYNISEISHQPLCHTDYEPRMKNALSDIILPVHSNWTYDLSFLDKAAVEKSTAKGYGYIDRKYVYTSAGVNSTLTLTVRNEVAARLWLCEVQKGFAAYPAWAADLADGADVYIRYNYTPTATAVDAKGITSAAEPGNNGTAVLGAHVYQAPDLSLMQKIELKTWYIQCARTSEVPPGTHMLTLVQKADRKVNLAYVVSWT